MFLRKFLSFEQPKTEEVDEIHDNSAKTKRFMIKEPGPYDSQKHCIFIWNTKISTFYLYENPNPSSATVEKGKFLLAARKFKHPSHIEYVMSLDGDDFCKESNSYVGKLSSDYLGINFTIYENGASYNDAVAAKQISPTLANSFKVGQICYEFDELKSKGPRYFVCFIKWPSGSVNNSEVKAITKKNPNWHEDLQCLCFRRKYKVAGYAASEEKCQTLENEGDKENILFRSKRVGDDTSTLVYQYPYSALQAFAIRIAAQDHILCLSS